MAITTGIWDALGYVAEQANFGFNDPELALRSAKTPEDHANAVETLRETSKANTMFCGILATTLVAIRCFPVVAIAAAGISATTQGTTITVEDRLVVPYADLGFFLTTYLVPKVAGYGAGVVAGMGILGNARTKRAIAQIPAPTV